MAPRGRRSGAFLILVALVLLGAIGALFAAAATFRLAAARERTTERALAQAREALIAYAADRPINALVGPGYLPCPDLDGDGWAESTCGSLDGSSGQEQRLGFLPWKTLGLPMLADGDGERLWHAVSSKYKGLLNCGVSRGCVDMSPPSALGTITVRDASGRAIHDGTIGTAARAGEGGAAAVVIAPGAPLARLQPGGERAMQRRDCAPGECDGAGRCLTDPPRRSAACDPASYLDRAPSGEDNADFVDRNDASGRAGNANGFIAGPVTAADGSVVVNDRIAVLAYSDVMPAILKRVAMEALHCLRYYATRPENAARYPWPAPTCREGSTADAAGRVLGGIADTPFARTAGARDATMLARWWRTAPRSPEALEELPTTDDACRIAVAPLDAGPVRSAAPGTPAAEGETASLAGISWWASWQPFVSYALAPGFAPDAPGTPGCAAGRCLELASASGPALVRDAQAIVVASTDCAGAPACDPIAGCARIVLDDSDPHAHGIAAFP
jgi:hypothetical protein